MAMNPTPSADLVGLSSLQRAGAKSLNHAIRHIDAEISRHHRETLDAYLRTLTGFNTFRREGIDLSSGVTATTNADLAAAGQDVFRRISACGIRRGSLCAPGGTKVWHGSP